MNIFKMPPYILWIILIICIVIAGVLLISYTFLLNDYENDTNTLNSNLQDKINKLTDKTEELNQTESFLNSYLNGMGHYYAAVENHSTADRKFNRSMKEYNEGDWSSAIAWFEDSMKWYNITQDKYIEARDVFQDTMNYTDNNNYINICNLYYDMADITSNAIVYLHDASEYYLLVCENYLDGDYEEAHKNRDRAEIKINNYNDEILVLEDYQSELQNLLLEITY